MKKKRCKDCKWWHGRGFSFRYFVLFFVRCYNPDFVNTDKYATMVNHCQGLEHWDGYCRKWWKFWRPK